MKDSKIEWTDHTFNPWIGCTKISEACQRCYAETQEAVRFKRVEWGPGKPRRRTTPASWRQPRRWNRAAAAAGARARVFCASLADVFDAEVPEAWRADLFEVIRATGHLDWLLLTKRPENLERMLPGDWGAGWPNVWLGTTAENQRRADERLPLLLRVPAAVRFASCEPLLGRIDLTSSLAAGLTWVIVGGETGHGARALDPAWARDLRDQCAAQSVAFHFKQWGDHDAEGRRAGRKSAGRILDGRTWDELPASRAEDCGVHPPRRWPATKRLPAARKPRRLTGDLRRRAVAALEQGRPTDRVAADLGLTVVPARAIKAHMTMGTYG